MTNVVNNQPWYAPSKRRNGGTGSPNEKVLSDLSLTSWVFRLSDGFMSIFLASSAGFLSSHLLSADAVGLTTVIYLAAIVFLVSSSLFFLIRQMGRMMKSLTLRQEPMGSHFEVGLAALRGEVSAEDARRGVPAPELALHQFVQQVRAYANEKSFQKVRASDRMLNSNVASRDSSDLLKRRWNEVLDTLSEFEVYLANDPANMIESFVSKSPLQIMDVSKIFRDVAECFDNTWRRKGINIESAIVTPLKATTNEALLRRLLVGLWRTCAYLARRGNGVIFSAKSEGGVVVARWECEGLVMPDEFLSFATQSHIPVNERIEAGLSALATDPINGNTLHALVSFITWIDLALYCKADFEFKQATDGFVFLLKFR